MYSGHVYDGFTKVNREYHDLWLTNGIIEDIKVKLKQNKIPQI